MKEFMKKHLVVVVAFSLPILVIVGVALSVYLPSFFVSTNYNFVYAMCTENSGYYPRCSSGYLQKQYVVVDGKLTIVPINPTDDFNRNGKPDVQEGYTPRIFLHDTEKNESREITVTEARALTLNNLLTSPDGVSVSSDWSGGADFLFVNGRSSYGHYLVKGKSRQKLNLINDRNDYYYGNFQFIGWVVPGRN